MLAKKRVLLPSGYTGGQQRKKNHLERRSALRAFLARKRKMQVHFRTKKRPFTSGIEVVVVFVVACTWIFER